MFKEYGRSNVLALPHACDGTATYGILRELLHIDILIPTQNAILRHDPIGEQEIGTRHGTTIPTENGPRHMGYINLVTHCVTGLLEHHQDKFQDRTISPRRGTV